MSSQRVNVPSVRLSEVLDVDDTLPIAPIVRQCWLKDLQNPLRWFILPVLRILCTIILHIIYFVKRLIPIQFSAHGILQWLICFFMEYFVSPEANLLIIRHFGTESNLINFIIANSKNSDVPLAQHYPETIWELMEDSFVMHDQALFRSFRDLGPTKDEEWPKDPSQIDWSTWKDIDVTLEDCTKHWTQFLDFDTAHELFKSTFCFWLTAQEYQDAINSFQLDQSVALRIGRILGDPEFQDLTHNRFPLVLTDTISLSYRFALHGLFVEHIHEMLDQRRVEAQGA
ncbi:MAG: hypothetical protein CMK59_11255 [Proteobacteria bacterium]|nr:hypothetical protein [Pseudomonadota bacterium]